MAAPIISYAAAKAAGLKRYFTGESCKHGHVAERFVSNCACVECSKVRTLSWSNNNTADIRLRKEERYPDLRVRQAAKTAAYRRRHPEVAKEYKKRWLSTAQGKAQNAAYASKRRAVELKRTPAWADLRAIEAKFAEAVAVSAKTGIQHHVDHEIPLQGKLVSGLHVPGNLRVIPAVDNMRKHNFYTIQ